MITVSIAPIWRIIDADLQTLGFHLYMRDDAEEKYHQDIQDKIDFATGKTRIAEKQQSLKNKLGL